MVSGYFHLLYHSFSHKLSLFLSLSLPFVFSWFVFLPTSVKIPFPQFSAVCPSLFLSLLLLRHRLLPSFTPPSLSGPGICVENENHVWNRGPRRPTVQPTSPPMTHPAPPPHFTLQETAQRRQLCFVPRLSAAAQLPLAVTSPVYPHPLQSRPQERGMGLLLLEN